MKTFLAVYILLLTSFQSFSQTAANTWSVKFSDAIISRWPIAGGGINTMTGKGWEYSNTIMTHGMEKVYNNVPTAAYLTYIQNYVDGYVNSSGVISASLISLDRVHPGISCLFLYEKTGLLKYKTAATTLRNLLVGASATYPKTSTTNIFWHKNNGSYDNIVMLDGIYMAHPFLAKYGSLFGDNAARDTAINQTLFVYSQLYDNTTHLIKHAWTSTPASYAWANSSTGNSSEVWSRAMGWYMMALVDILKYVPAAHPKRANLLTALSNLAIGVKTYQDATTGLWYQVVDKGIGKPGYTAANYIETSGSAMFVYALKTAVDSGWLSSATYLPVAQSGWAGLKAIEITIYSDSKPQINNFAPAMSVQNNYAGYVGITSVDCPATTNPHGYAAILMAASVMEFPLAPLPVKFTTFSAKVYADNVHLYWQNADDTQVDYYAIQKSNDGIHFNTIGKINSDRSGNYNWVDNKIDANTSYYRIQAVSEDGAIDYTNILLVKIKNSKQQVVTIAPNPATGNSFTISVSNLLQGNYTLKIFSSAGETIDTKSIFIGDEKSISQTIILPASVSKGLYYVQLKGEETSIYKSILIN
jgi:unsaturated rhamnogalacturonyl hydrolase